MEKLFTSIGKKGRSLQERFLALVCKSDSTTCWQWVGSKHKKGYGSFMMGSRKDNSKSAKKAHRVSYELFKEPIPHGFVIDHVCRNRSCVNPEHLRAVTPSENTLENSFSNSALNKMKTHCLRGHLFSAENTYFCKIGIERKKEMRTCLICRQLRAQRRKEKQHRENSISAQEERSL